MYILKLKKVKIVYNLEVALDRMPKIKGQVKLQNQQLRKTYTNRADFIFSFFDKKGHAKSAIKILFWLRESIIQPIQYVAKPQQNR